MLKISDFASGIPLANSFSQSLLCASRQTLPLVFHTAMIFNSEVCLESGIRILIQKGTFAYRSWFDGVVTRNLHMCGYLRQSDATGFVVISFFHEGRSMNVAVSSVLTAAE